MNITRAIFTVFVFAVGAAQSLSVDWADFRGPNGNPVHDGDLPLSWDSQGTKNVAWKAPLPGRGG